MVSELIVILPPPGRLPAILTGLSGCPLSSITSRSAAHRRYRRLILSGLVVIRGVETGLVALEIMEEALTAPLDITDIFGIP